MTTPRPWKYNIGGRTIFIVHEPNSVMVESVATLDNDEDGLTNTQLIVHAVNTFDEAKAALKDMHRYLLAGPIKTKDDIEYCLNLIEDTLAKMEGR